MRKLNEAIDRFCALHPRLGVPGLMRWIVAANAATYLLSQFDRSGLLLRFLAMDAASVLRGEVWRLLTYVLIPTNGGFWLLISLFFYYWLGESLERLWGSAKFTVYYLSGALLTSLSALLIYFIDGVSLPVMGADYVNAALFFAYALTYPDAMVRIYFIIPVKMKWLAILEGVLYALSVVRFAAAGLWGFALQPVIALLNLFIFFSPDFSRRADQFPPRGGAVPPRGEGAAAAEGVQPQVRGLWPHGHGVPGPPVPLLLQVHGLPLLLPGPHFQPHAPHGVNRSSSPAPMPPTPPGRSPR